MWVTLKLADFPHDERYYSNEKRLQAKMNMNNKIYLYHN